MSPLYTAVLVCGGDGGGGFDASNGGKVGSQEIQCGKGIRTRNMHSSGVYMSNWPKGRRQ